ncbi:MAG: GFA family protein [Rhodospirillales bacterium]|nr:GFA family protein [Rhodospirillales bacterium]
MTTGSCLCGTVRWRMEQPFRGMTHCHCSMCRKAHGAPFATYINVPEANYHLLAGENAVTGYQSSATYRRAFCGRCGSVVPSAVDDDAVYVPAGCLDDDPGIRPSVHEFAASKAPWHVIADDLPRAETFTEIGLGLVIERPKRRSGKPGVLNGSCLCGGVAYEVGTPMRVVHNCHCSRCRKARAAAHTTNGFAPAEGLRYLCGVELLRRYKVPGAKVFSQTFCRVCGSGMPRPDATQGLVAIPFGSLDDDPGRGAADHIYTAYKAPWYDIADDLPQCAEGPGPPTGAGSRS